MLELINIHKSFGDRKVLDGVNFKLERGKIYTLMGANGTGKTTLVNIISGFLKADKGEIILKKKNINGLSIIEINSLGVTRTFQNQRLIEKLIVKDNILLAFKKNKGENFLYSFLSNRMLKKYLLYFNNLAEVILKEVFLSDLALCKAGEISYGQQKLLSLGCCIANDAELLLLDEPVAGINTMYKEKIIFLIKEMKKKGKTILLIDHNIDFIEAVSDRIFFLNEGTIQYFNNYQNFKNNSIVQEAYL